MLLLRSQAVASQSCSICVTTVLESAVDCRFTSLQSQDKERVVVRKQSGYSGSRQTQYAVRLVRQACSCSRSCV